jgi:HPt (histidine-containing phosphotransfer) domain-containing protein
LDSSTKTTILDRSVLAELASLATPEDPEIDRAVIELYLKTTVDYLAKIQKEYAAKNWPEVTRAAHTIKSSSANVGALALSALCRAIEAEGREKNPSWEKVESALRELPVLFQTTQAEMKDYLSKLASRAA